jgi:hypothetical protein
MKLRTAQCDCSIDRKDASGKSWQNMTIQPRSKYGSLRRVTTLCQQNSDFQFLDSDNRQVQIRSVGAIGPSRNITICLPEANLP